MLVFWILRKWGLVYLKGCYWKVLHLLDSLQLGKKEGYSGYCRNGVFDINAVWTFHKYSYKIELLKCMYKLVYSHLVFPLHFKIIIHYHTLLFKIQWIHMPHFNASKSCFWKFWYCHIVLCILLVSVQPSQ